MANSSNIITGATFDGYSFNHELCGGKPVLLKNVIRGETVKVNRQGDSAVEVQDRSAVHVGRICIFSRIRDERPD